MSGFPDEDDWETFWERWKWEEEEKAGGPQATAGDEPIDEADLDQQEEAEKEEEEEEEEEEKKNN